MANRRTASQSPPHTQKKVWREEKKPGPGHQTSLSLANPDPNWRGRVGRTRAASSRYLQHTPGRPLTQRSSSATTLPCARAREHARPYMRTQIHALRRSRLQPVVFLSRHLGGGQTVGGGRHPGCASRMSLVTSVSLR